MKQPWTACIVRCLLCLFGWKQLLIHNVANIFCPERSNSMHDLPSFIFSLEITLTDGADRRSPKTVQSVNDLWRQMDPPTSKIPVLHHSLSKYQFFRSIWHSTQSNTSRQLSPSTTISVIFSPLPQISRHTIVNYFMQILNWKNSSDRKWNIQLAKEFLHLTDIKRHKRNACSFKLGM